MLALDLGSTTWTLGFTTAPAQRPRIRTMPAGDLAALVKEIWLAKARCGLPLGALVRSCDEAGRDGFWLHRWLLVHDVEHVVVDASSIEVNRRARRAKTDRPDTSAAVFSAQLFGTRSLQNGRPVGAVPAVVPVPSRSDQRVQDQGISRAGCPELRRIAFQLAWGWVLWQPMSALTQWFLRRFGPAGGRSRLIGIVALARKLAIALWRYTEHGVLPEGATLKASLNASRIHRAPSRVPPLVASRSRVFRVSGDGNRLIGEAACPLGPAHACSGCVTAQAVATDRRSSGRGRHHTDRW